MTAPDGPIPSPRELRGARVVHLCSRRRVWSSPSLPVDEAEELFSAVRGRAADIGDGAGFIEFRCTDGRQVDVRARDLESIELRNAVEAPAHARGGVINVSLPSDLTLEQVAEEVARSAGQHL